MFSALLDSVDTVRPLQLALHGYLLMKPRTFPVIAAVQGKYWKVAGEGAHAKASGTEIGDELVKQSSYTKGKIRFVVKVEKRKCCAKPKSFSALWLRAFLISRQ